MAGLATRKKRPALLRTRERGKARGESARGKEPAASALLVTMEGSADDMKEQAQKHSKLDASLFFAAHIHIFSSPLPLFA